MKRKVIVFCLLIALTLTAVSALAACESDPIVGTWVSEHGSKYVFEKDGTVTHYLPDGTIFAVYEWKYTTQYTEAFPYTFYNEQGAPVDHVGLREDGTLHHGAEVFTKQ